MERALRNRLVFGTAMLAALFLLLWLDNAAEAWTKPWMVRSHHQNPVDYGVGGIGLMIILLSLLPIATDELAVLFTAENVRPYRIISVLGSGALAFHAFLTQFPRFKVIAASTLVFIIVFVMLLAALRRAWGRQSKDAIVRMAGTVLATLYLGGLGWFLMAIRVKHSGHAPNRGFVGSTSVMLMILLAVKSTDIGAYFGGRAVGRRKLIPWLSPGKTWEGLLCGLLTSAVVGGVCSRYVVGFSGLTWWNGALFGAFIGAVGQAGDLLESLMKRDADVKDSGRLIPGFGGVLDVIDSPLFAAPFAYLWFSLMFHAPGPHKSF